MVAGPFDDARRSGLEQIAQRRRVPTTAMRGAAAPLVGRSSPACCAPPGSARAGDRPARVRLAVRVRDIGIALVTTLIARRSQFHQASLAAHLDAGSSSLIARLGALTRALQHAGDTSVEAARQAYGVIYRQLSQQAQTLAYADVIFVFACFAAAMVPLVFLTRERGEAGDGPLNRCGIVLHQMPAREPPLCSTRRPSSRSAERC